MKKNLLIIFALIVSNSFSQNGLNFDKTSDFVQTTFPGILGINDITVEAWIKTTGGGDQIITAWGNESFNGGRFTFRVKQVGSNNVIRIENKGSGLDGLINVADSSWHHVAVTYSATTTTNKYKLYVDGTLDNQGNISQPLNIISGVNLRIGRRIHATYTDFFGGKMDEVRVWNVVRTQAQISANKGIEFCSNPTGLVAYYQFNLGVAGGTNTGLTTLPDLIGSNNGTLQTFSLTGSLSNWITGVALTRRGAINTQSISICSGDSLVVGPSIYKTPGIYIDSFTTATSCDSIVTTNLSVDTVDKGTTTSGRTISSNLTWANFQWIDCGNGNAIITGETNRSYTPSIDGNYAVIINDGGCIDTSECVTITSTNLTENELNNINIFPNPASNEISVTLKDNLISVNKITIINAIGEEIINLKDFVNGKTISIVDLKPGIYFIKIIQKNNVYTKMFLKQ